MCPALIERGVADRAAHDGDETMGYEHKATQAALAAMFPKGLNVKVGTGEKDANGASVFDFLTAHPAKFNEQTLRHTLSLGLARWHGQHLNNVSADGGAKRDAFAEMLEEAHKGETPSAFVGKRAASPGGNKPLARAVNDWIATTESRVLPKLEAAVDAGALKLRATGRTPTGNARAVKADWVRLIAENAPADVAALIDVKDGAWNASRVGAYLTENKPELIAAARDAIAQEAANRAAALEEVGKADDVKAALADLF